MKRREAKFGLVNHKEAILEVAEVVGLPLVPVEQRDPRYTSSYGVGELIAHILEVEFVILRLRLVEHPQMMVVSVLCRH